MKRYYFKCPQSLLIVDYRNHADKLLTDYMSWFYDVRIIIFT
jgi:hypothetical protein